MGVSQDKLRIIGVAGTNGAGKDLLGQLLAERHNYLFISVTNILREELQRRSLPPDRAHMRELSAEWRRERGFGVLVELAVEKFKATGVTYAGVVMASLRNPYEADEVHKLDGTVVWVDADPKLRYERIQANAVARGATRAVDDQKTFEQFLSDEEAEMHQSGDEATLNMSAVRERSDITILNDGDDIAVFADNVDRVVLGVK
jgi:dephospho-CoA kinase